MIEGFLESFIELVLRIFTSVVIEFLIHVVFYNTGWFFIRLITIGRYPPSFPLDDFNQNKSPNAWISGAGFLVWVNIFIIIYLRYFSETDW